ncbi:MAG: DMT family transporter, partial [Candidatus Roizmanbacteria bacterium]
GIIIGFLGVNLVIFLPLLNKNIFNREAVFGNFLIMIGCLLFSYYTTASKKFLEKYSPLTLTTAFIFTTTLVTLFFSLFELSSFNSWFSQINLVTLWAIFYTVVIGTVVAYFLQQYAIHHGTPLIASLTQYIAPGTTMLWSNIILREKFNFTLIVGTIITLLGAWLVTRES